jgi:hypothetical protein
VRIDDDDDDFEPEAAMLPQLDPSVFDIDEEFFGFDDSEDYFAAPVAKPKQNTPSTKPVMSVIAVDDEIFGFEDFDVEYFFEGILNEAFESCKKKKTF